MVVNCPECGQQLPDSVNFCSNCGASLRSSAGETTRVIPVQVDEPARVEITDSQLSLLENVPAGTGVLLVVRGPNLGSKYLLDRELVSVGRHPQSDIFLDDVTVSRHHARLVERGGHRWIADLNSLNGTYVNRALIDGEVALRNGDEVQIGKFRMVFLVRPAGRG